MPGSGAFCGLRPGLIRLELHTVLLGDCCVAVIAALQEAVESAGPLRIAALGLSSNSTGICNAGATALAVALERMQYLSSLRLGFSVPAGGGAGGAESGGPGPGQGGEGEEANTVGRVGTPHSVVLTAVIKKKQNSIYKCTLAVEISLGLRVPVDGNQ